MANTNDKITLIRYRLGHGEGFGTDDIQYLLERVDALQADLARVTAELERYITPIDAFKKRMAEDQPHEW